jgi:hypothetical protein
MTKNEAIDLLGGHIRAAATRIGCSRQAVSKWPDPLPERVRDRVQAALWREISAGEDSRVVAERLRVVMAANEAPKRRRAPALAALAKP